MRGDPIAMGRAAATKYGLQIAAGLAAHRKGMIHRDFKLETSSSQPRGPSNVQP